MKKNHERKNLLVFGYGLALILSFIGYRVLKGHGPSGLAFILLSSAIILFFLTLIRVEMLKSFYALWMKGAHFLGTVIMTVMFTVIFYLIFAPIGILFRIIRKDHLNRNIDKNAKSYWNTRQLNKDHKRYLKQY